MAKSRTDRKSRGHTEHKAYWQQPWVQGVMQGDYSSFDKLLFVRVASFGVGGCWMENKTLMAELGRSESTVRTAITKLWEGKEIWVTNWNNHKRRIYAARNPEVMAMAEAWYQEERKAGKVTDRADFHCKIKSRLHITPQKAAGYPVESCGVGGEKLRGYPAENNGVHISESRERIEEAELRRADSSSAADEQPNPPAIDVNGEDNLAKLKEKLRVKTKPSGPPLTQAEMKDKAQKQKTALLAVDQMDQEGGKQ